MKRLLSSLLTICLIAGLAGCGMESPQGNKRSYGIYLILEIPSKGMSNGSMKFPSKSDGDYGY